jgi:predicted Zn-dependent protease
LYDVGCILFHVAGASGSTLAYTSAMWASASDMGSRLATICVARQMVRSGAWGKKSNLRPVENNFRKLVAEGKNPNALAVQAELLWMAGNYTEAAKTAKKALDIGKGDFEWEPECRLSLAKAYVKLKRDAEAKEVLDSLSEMSFAEAHEYLGYLLLPSDADKAEQHFFNAGYYGRPGMYQQLSEIAVTNGSKAVGEEEKKEYSRWAMEWAHLANPKAEF